MQRCQRLAVPIEIGQEEEAGSWVGGAVDDVFLLGQAVEDVIDPCQSAFCALGRDPGPRVGSVDGRGFGDDAEGLR